MAKFNISVEIDYIDEEGNLDEEICAQIVERVVDKVSDSVKKRVESEAARIFDEQVKNAEITVSDRLNELMESFFDTPKDITDDWGNTKRKGVTVRQLLKEACDNFMNQPLDKNGNPAKSSYDRAYSTRVDYFVHKAIDTSMEIAIKQAVGDVTSNIKKQLQNEIKAQMGENIAKLINLDGIVKGAKV